VILARVRGSFRIEANYTVQFHMAGANQIRGL